VSKRLKILLIVLGVLLLLGAGSATFFMMTAETPEEPMQLAAKPVKPKPAPAPKPADKPSGGAIKITPSQQGEAPKPEAAEMKAEAVPEAVPAPEAKPKAEAGAKPETKTEAKPEAKAEAKPGAKAETPAKPETKPEKKCDPVITARINDKDEVYKTPEEFVDNSGMTPEEFTAFGQKFLGDKKKELEKLKATKDAPKEDVECAEKYLALANSLNGLVLKKFPVQTEREVYTYLSLDKRDPFMSPFQIPKAPCKVPSNAPPVQQQPAETLKVDGIMWNEKGFRALLITTDGRGDTVKVGDGAGNKCGKITDISKTKVTITEWIPDIFDNIEVRETVIKLYN